MIPRQLAILPLAVVALSAANIQAAEPLPARDKADGPGGPYKVVAADFTGDGKIDLAIGYHRIGVVAIEQGDGEGNFSRVEVIEATLPEPSEMGGVYNLTRGDIDNDGRPDLAFAVHGSPPNAWRDKDVPLDVLGSAFRGTVTVARNLGQGRFEKIAEFTVQSHATGAALADLDRDGRIDLLYAARGTGYKGDVKTGTLFLRRGLPGLKFADAIELPAGPSAYFVETADLNGDGLIDFVVPNEHGVTVQYWINPGRELFQKPEQIVRRTLEATPIPDRRSHALNHVQAGDFNGDGKQDLLTANLGTSTVSLFPGNGDGSFQKDALFEGGKDGAPLATGDLNADGSLDFAITHWTGDFLSVFLNAGRGQFPPKKDYGTGLGCYGVTLVDVDGDGTLDALTANYRDRTLSLLKGVGDGTFRPAVTTKKGLKRVKEAWVAE